MSKNNIASQSGTKPLHAEIRAEISRRIDASHYKQNEPLPSAAMLSEEFGVSMITVKRALKDLQNEGLLTARAGLGTFVKRRRRFVRDYNVSLNSMGDAQRLGFKPRIELVSVTYEKVGQELESFGDQSEPLLCVRKVIYADDVPVMFDTTFVTADLGDDFHKSIEHHLIYDALKQQGIQILKTDLTIDATPASVETQTHCKVPNGYPCLSRRYHYQTDKPGLEFFGYVESPFDRLSCTVSMSS
ncbi:GntR family transcriptional regulator [Labrenzia sp. DG1229]|uniref:GntR family transcriptional regulator n=1 Tax=Labrenzia sp. DG1229 TaxID=681847 RepID=UPI00069037CD|nr:GntR family transcriptional regulator [Labrenzia sp. DG1229]